jgi:tetratricopeptide (TPR) repeat protein
MRGARTVIFGVLIIELFAPPLPAQKHGMGSKTPISLLPPTVDDRVVVNNGNTPSAAGDQSTCSIQPFPGVPDTASVTSLQVPAKAQKEYERACTALKRNQLSETERHLRKATGIYPQYVAGWVMLGQVLDTQKQTAKGLEACSRASAADPKYVPAYLCLAEIQGREQKWNEVLQLTNHALELDPVGDAYGYFFSAIAYLNLNQLPEAQQQALKAEEIDKDHREPLIQFLLAQIYQVKHDSANAVSSFRTYRKLVADSQPLNAVAKKTNEPEGPK